MTTSKKTVLGLSEKETIVYNELKKAAENSQPCPTYRQLSNALGFKSDAASIKHFNRLEEYGLISVERGHDYKSVTLLCNGKQTLSSFVSRSSVITPTEQIILDYLKDAAHEGRECPSNSELCVIIGADSLATPVNVMNRLKDKGYISVKHYQRARQVKILSTGAETKTPNSTTPHWRHKLTQDRRAQLAALKAA